MANRLKNIQRCRHITVNFAQRGDWTSAVEYLSKLENVAPDSHVFNAVLTSFSKAKIAAPREIIFSVLGQMDKMRVAKNTVSYNVLTSMFAKHGDLESAMRFVHNVDNVACFNSVIKCCAKIGDTKKAETLMINLKNNGLQPTVVTYGLLIDCCARTGDIVAAEKWFAKLTADAIKPDVQIFGSVIHAFARGGDAESASKWLNRMQKINIADRTVFNCVISACAQTGLHQEAARWMDTMRAQRLEPCLLSYTSVLQAVGYSSASQRLEQDNHL
eukprot:gene405-116_t